MPLLVVHGAGGGHDQGMEFLTHSRLGVIANDTLWLPAYSNACKKSAVIGISAGAPSAMQVAIRYLNRVSALVLIVPIAYKPSTLSNSAPPLSRWTEKVLMHLIWSVFVFWIALHVARAQVIKYVLAILPELVTNESQQEQARVIAMAEHILSVFIRAKGLRDETLLGMGLPLYPLESISAPTLIIGARDDRFGTYASAQ